MNSTKKQSLLSNKCFDETTEALATMFFGCNLKFNLVESPLFLKFVKCLNPHYTPPKVDKLKGPILESFHGVLRTKLWKDNVRKGTIMIDGWKNKSDNSKQVAVMIKPRHEKEIFLKSFDFSSTPENHIELLKVISESEKIAKHEFNVIADSFISDNAKNVRKAGIESSLIDYGCLAHIGNLYFNDIRNEKIYKRVHEVMVAFRQPQLESQVSIL